MLLIKNAKIFPVDGPVIEKGDILIKDGKIAEVGPCIGAPEAEVLDASGLCVTPGLVDAHTHAGGFSDSGMDLNEGVDPSTPHMRAFYGTNINDPQFQLAHKVGVTSVCVAPGSANVICGHAFATKTYGKSLYDMVMRDPCALKCAMGGNPKGYGARGKMPKTRMGVAFIFKDELRKAKEYMEKKDAAAGDPEKMPKYDAKCEAIIPALRREIPLKVHSEQFDMLTVIEIAKEFGCRYTIDHGWLCNMFADEIVEGGGDLLFGPAGIPEGAGELTGGDLAFLKEMDDRGVNVAIITDSPIFSAEALLIQAGDCVRYGGVAHDRALRMITVNAAKAMGVEDRIGTITVGKDADLAIFKGEPLLDTGAHVVYTIIDGNIVYKK